MVNNSINQAYKDAGASSTPASTSSTNSSIKQVAKDFGDSNTSNVSPSAISAAKQQIAKKIEMYNNMKTSVEGAISTLKKAKNNIKTSQDNLKECYDGTKKNSIINKYAILITSLENVVNGLNNSTLPAIDKCLQLLTMSYKAYEPYPTDHQR